MKRSTLRAQAPGKVILFGEHAVVYGHPSIGFPLSKQAKVTMKSVAPGHGSVQIVTAKDVQVGDTSQAASPGSLASRVLGSQTLSDKEIRIVLGFPPMSGFGSSAAIALALLELRRQLNPPAKDPSPRAVWMDAVAAEQVAHAKPSGVDPAICLHGAPIKYVRREDKPNHPLISKLKIAVPVHMVISSAGAHGGTSKTVSRLAQMKSSRASQRLIEAGMAALGEATDTGAKGLRKGDLLLVGHAMDLAHGVLSGLGLVSEQVDQQVRAAKAAGALGAKMSGAGGAGGAFVALAPDEETAKKIRSALRRRKLPAWIEVLNPA